MEDDELSVEECSRGESADECNFVPLAGIVRSKAFAFKSLTIVKSD